MNDRINEVTTTITEKITTILNQGLVVLIGLHGVAALFSFYNINFIENIIIFIDLILSALLFMCWFITKECN
tara:strand:+ start:186 stop:401 length:216 start_codon:yes stop_codon:yes gene_type:complete